MTTHLHDQSANPDGAHTSGISFAGIPWKVFAVLLVSTSISLVWSSYSLLTQDQFFSLWTDRVSSLGQIWHIQLTGPISVDPIAYHAFAHALILIFGANAFAMRLPSLIAYPAMQICLFVFVRRMAGEQAAVLAMAFPSLTLAYNYSIVGRPYGMLLGLLGVAMVSWQRATRSQTGRWVPLILLALALAMILNTSYSGVLLFAPFCIAELFRTCQRRRVDLPVVTAICMGGAGIVFALPLMKAAAEFRGFIYFPPDLIKPLTIVWTYLRVLSTGPRGLSEGVQMSPRLAFVLVIMAFALWGLIRRWRGGALSRSNPELVFLAVLVALPVLSYLLARFVTHTFEQRYSLGLVLGVAAFTGIGMSAYSSSKRIGDFILMVFLFAIVWYGIRNILGARIATRQVISSLKLTPEAEAALMASPSKQLYFQDTHNFAYEDYYGKDPYIKAHSVLVFSREQEIRWDHMDTASLTALHMLNFTQFNIVPYETLVTQPGDHVFVVLPLRSSYGYDWLSRALIAAHAEVKPVGTAFTGDVISVRFSP